jgi:hypothetical protein
MRRSGGSDLKALLTHWRPIVKAENYSNGSVMWAYGLLVRVYKGESRADSHWTAAVSEAKRTLEAK